MSKTCRQIRQLEDFDQEYLAGWVASVGLTSVLNNPDKKKYSESYGQGAVLKLYELGVRCDELSLDFEGGFFTVMWPRKNGDGLTMNFNML